jgi:DNA polymerase-3 subunit delta
LFEEEQTVVLNYFDEMKVVGFKDVVPRFNGLLILVLSEDVDIKAKSLTGVLALCIHVKCGKMAEYGSDYPVWITAKASERGYTFVDNADDILYKRVGPDMSLLAHELEKLMVFKEQLKTITPEDVSRVVGFSAAGSTYEILECLLKKDTVKSLKAFDLYLKNTDDLNGLIFFLGHYFEKLYRMVVMAENKVSPDGIASILNMHPFLIKTKYLPRALSLGKERLSQYIASVVELEATLRTSSIKEVLLNKFIYSFI